MEVMRIEGFGRREDRNWGYQVAAILGKQYNEMKLPSALLWFSGCSNCIRELSLWYGGGHVTLIQ